MLQKARGNSETFPLLPNPLENYSKFFDEKRLHDSIESCIKGPVDREVTNLENDYYKKVEERMNRLGYNKYMTRMLRGLAEDESDDMELEEGDEN